MIYYVLEITIDSFKIKENLACAPQRFISKDLDDIHTRLQMEMRVLDLDNFTVYPVKVEMEENNLTIPLYYCSIGNHRQIVQYYPEDADFSQRLLFSEETGLAKLVSI
jgi:hypothetical protein